MFTPSSIALTFLVLTAVFIGFSVGAVSGVSTSLLLKLRVRFLSIVVDGIFGVLGFLVGFHAVFLVPWRNTITYYVDHTPVASTMNHYQHPYFVALIGGILFASLSEVWRFKKRYRATLDASHDE